MGYLRQHSRYCDLRHLKAWMDGECPNLQWAVELSGMEPYVPARAKSSKHRAAVAQIHEQRQIRVEALYLPLVMVALSG